MPSDFDVRLPITVGSPPTDVWGRALGQFLAHLLDGVRVTLSYQRGDCPLAPPAGPPPEADAAPWSCARRLEDGWVSVLSVSLHPAARELYPETGASLLPPELSDFPDAAVRALDRITGASGPQATSGQALYPSVIDALHDVVVAEILAERVAQRAGMDEPQLDRVAYLVSDVLSYLAELSRSRIEGHSPTHGVVIGAPHPGLAAATGPVRYPPDFRHLKRAPLLFDGLRAAVAVGADGLVHGDLTHRSLALLEAPVDETLAAHGDVVAAGSRALDGVGLFLRADGSVWVFDRGQPLLLRRGGHWRAIPFASLTAGLGALAGSATVAGLVVRAALLASLEGEGAILAVAEDAAAVASMVEDKDRYDLVHHHLAEGPGSKESRLHQVVDADHPDVETLLRLAVIDGATIVDRQGRLVAYGAVVRSEASQAEGARTAAARNLSRAALLVVKVSEDGPVTVFRHGAELAAVL